MLAGRIGFAWLDDAGFVGQDDGLDPVAQAELGEQVAHVRFDGGLTDDEVGGDLGVGEAAGEAQRDAAFPGGQRCQPGRCGLGVRRGAGEGVDEPDRDRRREERVPRGGVLDGRDQVVPGASLSRKPLAPDRSAS
jgi:hypothetical protein